MRLTKLFFIIFLSLLIILSSVSAVQITSQTLSGALCPRETGLFTHSVRNDGSSVRNYDINLKGSASEWATVVPGNFILAPGEQRDVYTYVTPSESAVSGSYGLEIEASSPGDTRSITHPVSVKNCFAASLSSTSNSQVVCPSNPVKYTVSLTNLGQYSEAYHLSVNGDLQNKVSLSDSIIVLDKGKSKVISVFVTSPVEAGSYDFNIVADSESGRVKESLPLSLNVDACYDFTLSFRGNTNYSMCDRSYVVIPLNLRNDGTTLNSYGVNLEGPVWARIENNNFVLRDKEARSFNLIFAPTYGVNGDYNVRLTVTPERGDKKFVTVFDVKVKKCHSVDVEFTEESSDACKDVQSKFEAVITNNGEYKKTYKVEVNGPPWIGFNERDSLITLDPGQQRKVVLTAVPGDDAREGDYIISLGAVATDDSAETAYDLDELGLNVKPTGECFKTSASSEYENLVVYYDSSVIIPVEVRNEGTKKSDYVLSLSGSASDFTSLNPRILSLEPGKSDKVFLYMAPNANIKLGEYDAHLAVNLKDGPLLATKDFKVEITNERDRATDISTTEETNESGSLWSRMKNWFKRTFVGEEQVAPVNILGNSTVDPENTGFFNRNKYAVLGIVIFVLVLVLLAVLGVFRRIVDFFSTEDSGHARKRKKND